MLCFFLFILIFIISPYFYFRMSPPMCSDVMAWYLNAISTIGQHFVRKYYPFPSSFHTSSSVQLEEGCEFDSAFFMPIPYFGQSGGNMF